MNMLAVLGFATIAVFLVVVALTRTPVIAALVLTPVVAATVGGFGDRLGEFAVDGLRTVAPIASLIMFAVLYFGLMIDAGLFNPIIKSLLGLVRGDPIRLCLTTAALAMLVALDGDGSTTFLISITTLLPVHRRMRMDARVLPAIVALAAGVMNILPWGGPTARAMSVLGASVDQIFVPVFPAMVTGILWVFFAAGWLGRSERRRLASQPAPAEDLLPGTTFKSEPSLPVTGSLFHVNAVLTILVIVFLLQELFADWIRLPTLPAPLLFMIAFAIALPINRRTVAAQREQLASHAASAVMVVSMILAAGVFTGILNGSGMIKAMATVLASSIPTFLLPWFSQVVAISGMPLSLVFTADAYYFGVLPVFAEAASSLGHDPLSIGRAAVLGQMTTGFPLSPMTAATFILIGLSGVSLREHQRFTFLWAFGTTVVMTVAASVIGAL